MKFIRLLHVLFIFLPPVEVQGMELFTPKNSFLNATSVPSFSSSRSLQPSSLPSSSKQPSRSPVPSSIPSISSQPSKSLTPSTRPPSISTFPTLLPSSSSSPSDSTQPSNFPTESLYPSSSPAPSSIPPSSSPSASLNPTLSNVPTIPHPSAVPTASLIPSTIPSGSPSTFPSSFPSLLPSLSVLPTLSILPSNSPSDNPSSHPSESPKPSPSPSARPSITPSISPMPSVSPSESFEPSTSSIPSAEPSGLPSLAPSLLPSSQPSSNKPSAFPSLAPTSSPSEYPTPQPTPTPSAAPSVTILSRSASVIEMQIYGMPFMDESQQTSWQSITDEQVRSYWDKTPKAGVIVTDVETRILDQRNQTRRLTDQHTQSIQLLNKATQHYWANQVRTQNVKSLISYQQTIEFGYTDFDSRVKNNERILFTEPFHNDRRNYNRMLEQAFDVENEIMVTTVEVITYITSAPSTQNGENPTVPPNDNQEGMSGALISVLVIVVLLTMVAVVVGFFYNNRRRRRKRKQEADNWAAGEHRFIPTQQQSKFGEDSSIDDNVPQQIGATITTPNFPLDDDHYNMPASTFMSPEKDSTTSATSTDPYNDSEGGGSSRAESPYSYPVDNLLGNSEEDYELEESEDIDILPKVDDEVLNRPPSFGSSSEDDAPSLSGFNVTVTDIDEDHTLI